VSYSIVFVAALIFVITYCVWLLLPRPPVTAATRPGWLAIGGSWLVATIVGALIGLALNWGAFVMAVVALFIFAWPSSSFELQRLTEQIVLVIGTLLYSASVAGLQHLAVGRYFLHSWNPLIAPLVASLLGSLMAIVLSMWMRQEEALHMVRFFVITVVISGASLYQLLPK
jgi:hypothetical protein